MSAAMEPTQMEQSRRFLMRLTKEEMAAILPLLGAALPAGGTKAEWIDALFSRGTDLTPDETAFCDIYHYRSHGRNWHAHRLESVKKHFNATADLVASLHSELTIYLRHHVYGRQFDDLIWLRIVPLDDVGGVSPLDSPFFFVYRPCSPFLMVSRLPSTVKQFVLHALAVVFDCKEIQPLNLTGNTIDSLFDLLINQKSQGSYQAYRLGEHDTNPFTEPPPKRQRRQPPPPIVSEDQDAVDSRVKSGDDAYGIQPPVLQRLEFNVSTMYRGGKFDINETVQLRVTLRGSDVLAGLKQLSVLGIADAQLPPPFAAVTSSAQTTFNVTDSDLPD